MNPKQDTSTLLGIFSIIFWSLTVSFSRDLTETLGVIHAASFIYLSSGVLSCIYSFSGRGYVPGLRRIPAKYFLVCGSLFTLYMVCLYTSIGLSANRQQAIGVGIINYLWPSLTLAFSVPILKKNARLTLIPGIITAFAGTIIALLYGKNFTLQGLSENLGSGAAPYVIAFIGAVFWALYSNLSRKLSVESQSNATPIFILMTGVLFTAAGLLRPLSVNWTVPLVLKLAYMVIFCGGLAYIFWDLAMRKGDIILVATLSNFTPVLSTVISCLYLKVSLNANLLIACVLVTLGAFICNYSIDEK
jgi:drug/metabolite transporter (DMT)-like permease